MNSTACINPANQKFEFINLIFGNTVKKDPELDQFDKAFVRRHFYMACAKYKSIEEKVRLVVHRGSPAIFVTIAIIGQFKNSTNARAKHTNLKPNIRQNHRRRINPSAEFFVSGPRA